MRAIENILAILFPVDKLEFPSAEFQLTEETDIDTSAVLWRAYDVRQTGIEKHFRQENN